METGEVIMTIGSAFSCNWTGAIEGCVVRDLFSDKVTLSTAFKAHIEQVESWSVSPLLLNRFPDLWGLVGVEKSPVIRQRITDACEPG